MITAFNRCARILVSARSKGFAVDTTPDLSLLTEAAEKSLTSAVESIAPRLRSSGWSIDDLEQILAPATQPIHQFFDSVMVMAEDTKLRDARLGLVNQIVAPVASVVELTALEL